MSGPRAEASRYLPSDETIEARPLVGAVLADDRLCPGHERQGVEQGRRHHLDRVVVLLPRS